MNELAGQRPWLRHSENVDPRWETLMERFHTMPTFYFEKLRYPESFREARQGIQVLNAEIQSIQAKIREFDNLSLIEEKRAKALEDREKALRAERMRSAQVKIIEAWISDQGLDVEAELQRMNKQMLMFRKVLAQLLERVDLKEREFIEFMSMLNE